MALALLQHCSGEVSAFEKKVLGLGRSLGGVWGIVLAWNGGGIEF